MRAGASYDCAACERSGVTGGELCRPRCEHARDGNGNAPPPARRSVLRWDSEVGLSQVFRRDLFRLTVATKRIRDGRRAKRLLADVGDPVPIAEVDEGWFAVEGIVETLTSPTPETTPSWPRSTRCGSR